MNKNISGVRDLKYHSFVARVLQLGITASEETGVKNRLALVQESKRQPTQHEFYLIRAARAISQLLNVLDQLILGPSLISQSPSSKSKKAGITKHQLLVYDIENYLIRATGVYDRVLRLVDAIFHIGNEGRFISHGQVVSNCHVSNSKLLPILKKLKKILEKTSGQRHLVAHEETYDDQDLRMLEMYTLYNTYRDQMPNARSVAAQIPSLSKKIMKRTVTDFEKQNSKIQSVIVELFEALPNIYNSREESLRAVSGIDHWSDKARETVV